MTFPRVLVFVACVGLGGAGASAAEISREDLQRALDANPDLVLKAIAKDPEALMTTIRGASQRAQEVAEQRELDESFKNPLKPIIGEADHVRGNRKAKYTLVEYSDFQCPFCSRAAITVDAMRKKYGSDLVLIYKNLPLPMHPMAQPCARYFEAAAIQSQDKAWALHDRFFENQGKLSEAYLKEAAKSVGLDVAKLEKDAASEAVKNRVAEQMKEAESFGFTGTPGFLINGIPVRGAYPIDYFNKIIARLDKERK